MTQSSARSHSAIARIQSDLRPERRILDNGIILLVTPNPTADIVAARLFFRAGLTREDPTCWGLSHLVASVMTKGTDRYSAAEIAQVVEAVGAMFGVDSTPDYFVASLKTVSEDFAEILALAAHVLRSPTFPDRELETERKATLQAIKARAEQPLSAALRPLRAAIHGVHPYSQTGYGTSETVAALKTEDLRTFHAAYFRPDDMVISIAGNITSATAEALVHQYFGDWQSADPAARLTASNPCQIAQKSRILTDIQATQQTIIALGYPAVSVHHPDYIGLKFLMTYLCNGMSSRLFSELREKQGLAYEVSGFYPTRHDNTHFVTYLGTTPENTERAFTQMTAEVERLAAGAMTAADLAIAKRKWAGQYALGKQTNRQIAQIYGWYEILGLGDDYDGSLLEMMQAYPLEQVQQVASRYLRHPVYSVVGPESSIQVARQRV